MNPACGGASGAGFDQAARIELARDGGIDRRVAVELARRAISGAIASALAQIGLGDHQAVGQDHLLARLRRPARAWRGRSSHPPRRPPPRRRIPRPAPDRWRRSAGSVRDRRARWSRSATRANRGSVPCSRSDTSRRNAICRSERVVQHRQPLPSSVTSSVLARTSASSIPTAPNSLITTAVPCPSGDSRKRRTSVVLPAPRKPVTMVTGMRVPRACLSCRPNGPAAREGKRSSMVEWRVGVVTCVSGE